PLRQYLRFAEHRHDRDGRSKDDAVVDEVPESKNSFEPGSGGGFRGRRFHSDLACFPHYIMLIIELAASCGQSASRRLAVSRAPLRISRAPPAPIRLRILRQSEHPTRIRIPVPAGRKRFLPRSQTCLDALWQQLALSEDPRGFEPEPRALPGS